MKFLAGWPAEAPQQLRVLELGEVAGGEGEGGYGGGQGGGEAAVLPRQPRQVAAAQAQLWEVSQTKVALSNQALITI